MENEYIYINRQAYNKVASQHMKRHNNISSYEPSDEEWKVLFKDKLLNTDICNKILEIGPGTGRILKIFEDNFNCRTIAVDLAWEMIKYARIKSPNTFFIEDNIFNVRFYNDTYDAIVMGALIHCFPKEDAKKLLELIYGWLKVDGRVLIYTTIHKESEEGYYEKEDYDDNIIRYRKRFTLDELLKLIQETKFRVVYKEEKLEVDRDKNWVILVIEKDS